MSESLSITHPELLKEWDLNKNSLSPNEIKASSIKKVWWLCRKCSHSWLARINNRTYIPPHRGRAQGCPACSNRTKAVTDIKNFQAVYPDKAKHWSPDNNFSPKDITPKSGKMCLWICDSGHTFKGSARNIANRKTMECCCRDQKRKTAEQNRAVVSKHESAYSKLPPLSERFPELKSRFSSQNKASFAQANSRKSLRYIWECPLGHVYKRSISSELGLTMCPLCRHTPDAIRNIIKSHSSNNNLSIDFFKKEFLKHKIKPQQRGSDLGALAWVFENRSLSPQEITSFVSGDHLSILNKYNPPEKTSGNRGYRFYIPDIIKSAVLQRDHYTCQNPFCTGTDSRLHLDHRIPVLYGGKSTLDNLQTLCATCNLKKGSSSWDKFIDAQKNKQSLPLIPVKALPRTAPLQTSSKKEKAASAWIGAAVSLHGYPYRIEIFDEADSLVGLLKKWNIIKANINQREKMDYFASLKAKSNPKQMLTLDCLVFSNNQEELKYHLDRLNLGFNILEGVNKNNYEQNVKEIIKNPSEILLTNADLVKEMSSRQRTYYCSKNPQITSISKASGRSK